MLKISVALGTYNGARFLGQQLESLAAQTYLPAELVVCDDGSKDDTIAIIRSFARKAPFPVMLEVNERRLGYRLNFMEAAKRCSSELVSFCDQDDVWKENKLALIAPLFDDPDVLLAYHDAALVDANLNRFGNLYYQGADAVQPPSCGRPWWGSFGFSQVFQRRLLRHSDKREAVPSYDQESLPLAHDQWIMFLSWAMGKIRYVSEELALYRQHDSNACGQKGPPTLGSRLRYVLEDRGATYKRMSLLSGLYADLLLQIATEEDAPFAERAIRSSQSLIQLGSFYEDRAKTCVEPTLLRRWSAYNRLRKAGVYDTGSGWSFGRKARLKDLALGVSIGRFGSRLRPRGSMGDVVVSRRSGMDTSLDHRANYEPAVQAGQGTLHQ